MAFAYTFDVDKAIDLLFRFLAVEGITGQERAIARTVTRALLECGVKRRDVRFDNANQSIPLPTETGNLVVNFHGTKPGPRLLFMTHLDTVPLCAGAKPIRQGNRIIAAGSTALGGDNRTGVACLVNLATTLLEEKRPHPPLTLLFTVREESGLWGARYVNRSYLRNPVMGFNVDGRSASEITIGAVGANRWQAEIIGRAAHAGVHPERGISATAVGSLALAEVCRNGWFGKINLDGHQGTSNVGSFGGKGNQTAGEATNVVTDYALIRGEARSHDSRFIQRITSAYRDAFRKAIATVHDDRGRHGKVRFEWRREYYPFRIKPSALVVQHVMAAAQRISLQPSLRVSNGGLDANWMVRHRVQTITFGAGQNNIHALGEYVDLSEFKNGCELALALASGSPAS